MAMLVAALLIVLVAMLCLAAPCRISLCHGKIFSFCYIIHYTASIPLCCAIVKGFKPIHIIVSGERMVFTSDLSTSDFWLLLDMGYEPLGLVVGNSVFSIGVAGGLGAAMKGMSKGEVPQITELLYNARELALTRMKKEAEDLGADGIVEVKLKLEYMGGGGELEVTAIGTAVRKSGAGSGTGPKSKLGMVLPVDTD